GDVNVNAIAPGIAAALVATVAGLGVAIPALFGYNYLLTRIKDATADMHVFVDEFVTRLAEFYCTQPISRELAAEEALCRSSPSTSPTTTSTSRRCSISPTCCSSSSSS